MLFPQPPNEAERVSTLRKLGILDSPPSPAIDRICRITQQVLDVPAVLVTLVDQHRQWIKASCGAEAGKDVPREHAFCNYTILHDEVFVVPDAQADQTFSNNRFVVGEPYIRFYAGAPLTIRGGIRLGALCVIDSKPRNLGLNQTAILQGLGRLVVDELWLYHLEVTGQAPTQEAPSGVKPIYLDFDSKPLPTSAQIRAARGLLNWSSRKLAEAAGISLASIKRIETLGETSVRWDSLNAVIQAFEKQGVQFTRTYDGSVRIARMSEPDSDLVS